MPRLLLTLCLLAAVAVFPAFSEESGASNTVGFISWECPSGAWTPFAFPFTYYNQGHTPTRDLNDILIGGFNAGPLENADRIYDQNTGAMAYLDGATGRWTGNLTEIIPGHAYWVRVMPGNPPVRAVTAGEVDMNQVSLGMMSAGNFTPVGVREAGTPLLEASGLIESGFTGGDYFNSDRIIDQNTISFSFYNAGNNNWVGAFNRLQPLHAMWILVQPGHSGFEWIYTPSVKDAVKTPQPDNAAQTAPVVKKNRTARPGNQQ